MRFIEKNIQNLSYCEEIKSIQVHEGEVSDGFFSACLDA